MGEGRTSGNRVSVYEAATVLNLTVDAIRKRICRGFTDSGLAAIIGVVLGAVVGMVFILIMGESKRLTTRALVLASRKRSPWWRW